MQPRLRLAALAALFAPALLLADTPATEQWVVTSAKVTGAGGNQYVTGLRIVNPNSGAAPVNLYFLPQSDGSVDNAAAQAVPVTVPANSTLAIDDVIGPKFGAAAPAGGIRVESPSPASVPVWVLSQTLVVNALSSTGVPGTNGFAIPAQNTDQLVANGETAYIPYISSSTSSTSGYRTNVFLLSANGTGTTVATVALVKSDGTTVGSKDVTLARYGQTQINNIAAAFGYSANDTNLTATVTVKSGGPVATGASIIDNAIASISYAPPVKVGVASAIGNSGAFGLVLNDGFGFSGRLDIIQGAGDFVSMGIVIAACPTSPVLFTFQGFGPSYGSSQQNTNFVRNADGTISFAGTIAASGGGTDSTFNGTVTPQVDGSVAGTVTYTRASGAVTSANPCPGAIAQYSFVGTKAFTITP